MTEEMKTEEFFLPSTHALLIKEREKEDWDEGVEGGEGGGRGRHFIFYCFALTSGEQLACYTVIT